MSELSRSAGSHVKMTLTYLNLTAALGSVKCVGGKWLAPHRRDFIPEERELDVNHISFVTEIPQYPPTLSLNL